MVYVSEPDARAGHAAARFGMKFTFWYEAAQPDVVALRGAACCDATGSLSGSGQIEYDIPRCAEGDEECVHTLVSYQYLDVPTRSSFNPSPSQGLSPEEKADIDAGREVELVYVVGHQHLGAAPTGIKLFKDSTDELICESKPIMGQGTAPGDEKVTPFSFMCPCSCLPFEFVMVLYEPVMKALTRLRPAAGLCCWYGALHLGRRPHSTKAQARRRGACRVHLQLHRAALWRDVALPHAGG